MTVLVAAFAIFYLGFAGLSLSMRRHQEGVFATRPSTRMSRGLRAAGWAAHLVATAVCVDHWGWGVGLTYACVIASAAGLMLILVGSLRPRAALLAVAIPLTVLALLCFGTPSP